MKTTLRALSLTLLAAGLARAEAAPPGPELQKPVEVRAVVGVVPPFVMEEGDELTGFCIDLWKEIAARQHLKTTYRRVFDVEALFGALRSGEADVSVTAVFYTLERDREFDFPIPILNTGQRVMVPDTGQGTSERPLAAFLEVLFSRSMVYWLTGALILILLPAHLMWFLDRRSEDGISPSAKYFPGIFHALVWAAEALVSQAQQMPKHKVARPLAILWLFTGVVFVAFFTAQLTTDLTIEKIRGAINGPEDLPGRTFGTLLGSPSVDLARELGARVRTFSNADEMYAALLDGEVDAVVLGAPALQYYASHEGLGKVKVVGLEFRKSDAGFVVPLGSPLRKGISTALLALKEDGTYRRIYEKWFGAD